VLLEAVPLTRDVRRDFNTVREADTRNLAERWVQTPRFWGEPFGERRIRLLSVLKRKRSAGAFVFLRTGWRPLRTS